MSYALTLVTAPAVEPVSRTEAKTHCRIDHTADDSSIDALIVAARRYVETITRRALIAQTWDLKLDGFPAGAIEIPLPPLQSVTSIAYRDSSGASTTVSASNYLVDTSSLVGRVLPAYGVVWPSFTAYPVHPVTVRFVAGYGAADDVPRPIRQALLMLVAEWYERREATHTGMAGASAVTPLPFAVEALLADYRVWSF